MGLPTGGRCASKRPKACRGDREHGAFDWRSLCERGRGERLAGLHGRRKASWRFARSVCGHEANAGRLWAQFLPSVANGVAGTRTPPTSAPGAFRASWPRKAPCDQRRSCQWRTGRRPGLPGSVQGALRSYSDNVLCNGSVATRHGLGGARFNKACPRVRLHIQPGDGNWHRFNNGPVVYDIPAGGRVQGVFNALHKFPTGFAFTDDKPASSYAGAIKITKLK